MSEKEGNSNGFMSLFEKRNKIFPARVKGKFRSLKWRLMWFQLGIYYLLPWIRWDRGSEGTPDQAVLIDIANRKFYFFFIEIWPQEVYIFVGLLILAAFTLFCATAILGRVWCGFFCPQTIWTDLFILVERFIEGDRNARARLDKKKWGLEKISKRIVKHLIWLFISFATGGVFVFYFGDAPTMLEQLLHFELGSTATFWMILLTITTYILAGFSREQVCTYMCPYARFQGAMYDENTLMVAYDDVRGEPRGKKKAENTGDCIDCFRCVSVCPTGIDIRDGSQYQCINCGLCVDACNEIMEKIGRPRNLIRFDTLNNISKSKDLSISDFISFKRPRAIIYISIITIVSAILLYAVTLGRTVIDMTIIKERNPLYITLSDGAIRNIYRIHITNKEHVPEKLELNVNADFLAKIKVQNNKDNYLVAEPDTQTQYKIFVDVPPQAQIKNSAEDIVFTLSNDKYNVEYKSSFNMPKR